MVFPGHEISNTMRCMSKWQHSSIIQALVSTEQEAGCAADSVSTCWRRHIQVTVIDTDASLLYKHYQVVANLKAGDLQ